MLYKYLSNFKRIKDVIRSKKLYASIYTKLNDPMEGIFKHYGLHPAILKGLKSDKGKLKICSLSEKCNDSLMWAHYANGERGIVIGVNRDSLLRLDLTCIEPIKYTGIPCYDSECIISAKDILSYKKEEWKYEKEVRIFTYNEFVPIEIEEIILGSRITSGNEKLIRNLIEETGLADKIRIEKLGNVLYGV